ncbi:hypothetical protein G6F22_008481 [Rhizopus arrhizus]|nr:hypothetical protein G6F23_011040 [Rhizopus arrhizus]KAG0783975.1 hypothetical protein G6F22_008481 [Rhizopus arrhizus]
MLLGQIVLDISKPINVQHISITFKGLIEGQGEKVVLIDESKLLALPSSAGQKYTVFKPEDFCQFDFEFKIPDNNNLPSSVKIQKVADIYYTLTATHKKPKHKIAQTLSAVVQRIKLLDIIDVDLPDFSNEINSTCHIGFLNNIQLTQWNIKCPRSAFLPGETIPVEYNILHFPPMNKPKGLKISFIQVIYKTNNPKVIDKKIIAEAFVDINTIDRPTCQSSTVSLTIPSSTPPTIFPLNGRIISVSYMINAEINMKGVKSTIQFKDVYTQESVILVGTYSTSNGSIDLAYHNQEEANYYYYNDFASPSSPNFSKPLLGPCTTVSSRSMAGEKSYFNDEINHHPLPSISQAMDKKIQRRNTDSHFKMPPSYDSLQEPNASLPNLHRPTSSSITIKPLGRLTEEFDSVKSTYKSPKVKKASLVNEDAIPLSSLPVDKEREHDDSQEDSNTSTPSTYHNSQSVHKFVENSSSTSSNTTAPSTKASKGSTVFFDSLVMMNQKDNVILYAPHEIGPHDVISKPQNKLQDSCIPGLFRQNTVSTASTNDHGAANSDHTVLLNSLTLDIREKIENVAIEKEEIRV